MASAEQLVPVGFSLAAALCWGTSDFSGGYASRRSDSFLITPLAHGSGLVLMLVLAFFGPPRTSFDFEPAVGRRRWCLGRSGTADFLSCAFEGMGLTAPVSAVLGAAIPAAFTMITHGLPGKLALAGFVLAGLGIWLIARPDGTGNDRGVLMAVLAGIGFAGFFLCIIIPVKALHCGRRSFRGWLRF